MSVALNKFCAIGAGRSLCAQYRRRGTGSAFTSRGRAQALSCSQELLWKLNKRYGEVAGLRGAAFGLVFRDGGSFSAS